MHHAWDERSKEWRLVVEPEEARVEAAITLGGEPERLSVTYAFVHACFAAGYTRIKIDSSEIVCWWAKGFREEPLREPRCVPQGYFSDRPALWTIVERVGLRLGCGSGGVSQHQCTTGIKLSRGVYTPNPGGGTSRRLNEEDDPCGSK
jgi:hypothetical protein